MKNLIIYNIGKTAEGLYTCICNRMKTKYLIYDIYVMQKYSPSLVRNARDINAVIRQGRTEGDFTLAVCLSVLITFVCAFCLGAFTRPYIGRLWRQICRKKSSASENTFSNQGFSAETLTRENTTNTQTSVQQNLSFCSGNSSRNVDSYIVEATSLHKVALHNRVLALNTEEANQDQSSNYIKVKKEKVSQNSQATNSAGEADIDIGNNDIFSAMSDHQCSNKAFQRELSNNDISSRDDSKYLFNEDSGKSRFSPIANRFNMDSYSLHIESSDLNSPFARETNFPFSEAQIQTNTQSSEYNDVNNRSNLLQSEIAESLQETMRQMTSHTQPLNTQQFMLKRHNYDKELDVNDNIDMLNNSENFILPSSCESDINIENSNTYQTQKNSASIQEFDCKEENTRKKDNPVDMFNDSSSTDEGSAFALSDSSSLTESELGQSNAGDDHLTNPSVTEQVIILNSGTGKFTTLLQSPTITTGFQDIMEKHENKNETYSETAIISGSGTGMSETYSSVLHIDSSHIDISDTSHIDKFDDHVTLSDSNTNNPPCCEVPGIFEYVTSPNSPAQNIISNPVCKQNINLSYVTLPPLKYSPRSIPDTKNIISKNTNLQLCEFSILTQHFDSSTPSDQKENVTDINTEENPIAQNSSLKNYREDGITLNIANINTPHMNKNFIFTSIDFGSNCVANKASLLHSNITTDEPFLQSHSESTDEKSIANITERQGSSVQEQQHMNMSGTYAQRMHRGFNERECNKYTEQEVLSGIDKGNSRLCTAEMKFHNIMTDSSRVTSSETMQSVFNEEKYLQLDHESEENVCFSTHPQIFFNENVQHSLYKVSQNAQENTIANRTNYSETENETSLAELENSSKADAILQNSSEKPDKKNEATRGQLLTEGSFFVKKKKAFDGFASVLQSRAMDSTK
ncbi:nucleotide exchange factor SIL1 [Platysternon megacephalum]|uniref:Nucleotide exchange factor SIL1 n=1 Tax=Platysternon megacephalum TaxID=55544 RepID=A0A4D9EVT2_9SAUR|nr:nucleotide exchange factor SIL1 [Platysternon megacephalum]